MTAQRRPKIVRIRDMPEFAGIDPAAAANGAEVVVGAEPETRASPVTSDVRLTEHLVRSGLETELADAIRRALKRNHVAVDDSAVQHAADEVSRARSAWARSKENFIDIGRALNRLEGVVGPRGYKGLVTDEILPFSVSQASKFRTIARAVDDQVVPADSLPGSFAGAYLICSASSEVRAAMEIEGLLQPDAKISDLLEVKKRIEHPSPPAGGDRINYREGDDVVETLTERERQDYLRRLRKLERERQEIDAQITRIRRLLG